MKQLTFASREPHPLCGLLVFCLYLDSTPIVRRIQCPCLFFLEREGERLFINNIDKMLCDLESLSTRTTGFGLFSSKK